MRVSHVWLSYEGMMETKELLNLAGGNGTLRYTLCEFMEGAWH